MRSNEELIMTVTIRAMSFTETERKRNISFVFFSEGVIISVFNMFVRSSKKHAREDTEKQLDIPTWNSEDKSLWRLNFKVFIEITGF